MLHFHGRTVFRDTVYPVAGAAIAAAATVRLGPGFGSSVAFVPPLRHDGRNPVWVARHNGWTSS